MSQLGKFGIGILPPAIPTTFRTTAGDAIPALNILTMTNGANITMSGAGSALTVALSGTTNHAIQIGNGTSSLSSLAIGTNGKYLRGVTGADPAWSTLTLPDTVTLGDVLVASANNVVGVVNDVVNAGYILTANLGAAPTFQAPPPGVTYASDAETIAGTVTNKAVAPSNLKAKLGLQTIHALPIGASDTAALGWLAVGANGETLMGSTGADCGWTSSPQFGGSVTATNDITSTAGSISSLSGSLITRDATNTATGPSLYFQKVRVAATIQSGDSLGVQRFTGYDGTGYITGAKITSTNSGTVGTNRVAGDLKFFTHPDSVIALPSEPLQRMTIAPTGEVTIATADSGTTLTVSGGGITCTSGAITATSGNVVLSSGNLTLPSTTSTVGQITMNGVRWAHSYGALSNTFVGSNSGNFTLSDTSNSGYGIDSLKALTSGYYNCSFGAGSGASITSSRGVCCFGRNAGYGTTTAHNSVYIGDMAGYNANATKNIFIGASAGYNATGSNCIYIGTNHITPGESGVLKIGSSDASYTNIGSTYIDGIYNTAVGATAGVVLSDSSDKLGGLAGAANTIFVGGTKPSFTATPQCTDLTLTGVLKLPTTTSTVGQIQINSVRTFHTYGTNNVFVGSESGNFTLTAANSTCVGYQTGRLLTSPSNSCLFGSGAGSSITSGANNCAFGQASLSSLGANGNNSAFGHGTLANATGSSNCAFGFSSLNVATSGIYNGAWGVFSLGQLGSGSYNLALGYCGAANQGAGFAYTGTESSNICIHNAGVVGESNKIRIGTQGNGNGQQDATYIVGIYGVTPGGTKNIALIDSNHQLGSTATLAQSFLTNGLTWNNSTSTPVTAAVNNEYTINTASGLTTINLPATYAVNDRIKIVGSGVDGWTLVVAAGDTIQFGSTPTSSGGSLSSTTRYDCVEVVCIVANSTWVVASVVGTLTVA